MPRRIRPSLDRLLVLVPVSIMTSVDGRSNWLEGAQLAGAYVIMAISFYFVETL